MQSEAVRELVATAERASNILRVGGFRRGTAKDLAFRLARTAEAVKAEGKPQLRPIKYHPLYAEITGQVHHIGGKP
jgi:hypothetical protein